MPLAGHREDMGIENRERLQCHGTSRGRAGRDNGAQLVLGARPRLDPGQGDRPVATTVAANHIGTAARHCVSWRDTRSA